jgi:hypothetical protein
MLINPSFRFRDVWGNSSRAMIDTKKAADTLNWIAGSLHDDNQDDLTYINEMIFFARDDVEDRTWDIPVMQVHQKIEEIINEQK